MYKKTYSDQETKRELTKKLMDSIEKLSNDIVTDRERLKSFAENWSKGYHIYSFGNYLLILSQRPNATICRGFVQWQKLGRYVNTGEKHIDILAPKLITKKETNETGYTEEHKILVGFLGVQVYDISQTTGKELNFGHSERITGKCEFYWREITKLFPEFNETITYEYDPQMSLGSTNARYINVVPQANKIAETAHYFHELAHCLMHWVKDDNGNWKQTDLPRDIKEIQAESVSYLVCSVFGIDTSQFTYEYLGNWQGDREKLGTSGTKILSCAEKIIRVVAERTKKLGELLPEEK